MWETGHTIEVPAEPHALWDWLTEVGAWPEWDEQVRWARLEGPLAEGARGRLRPRGGPPARFTVTRLVPSRRLTSVTRLPGATMSFDHRLEPLDVGSRLTHRVTIEGPAAGLFGFMLGRTIAAGLPSAMQRLAALAERHAKA